MLKKMVINKVLFIFSLLFFGLIFSGCLHTSQKARTISVAPPNPVPIELSPQTKAFFAEDKIIIDANLEEWQTAAWVHLTEPDIEYQKNWQGTDDLSARFAFAYDENNLYLAAIVLDDIFAQSYRDFFLWKGDCLQIALDPLLDRHYDGYMPDDYEIGIALVDNKPIAYQWGNRWDKLGIKTEIETAIKRLGDKTIYEVRFPLEELSPLVPHPEWPCGLNVVINDEDTQGRECVMEWTATSIRGKFPSSFGILEFLPPREKQISDIRWHWNKLAWEEQEPKNVI